uniref:Serine protease n=1 Tax=Sparus aurata TaxID=8175 RepID=A0A671UJ89_SPAAU
MYKNGFCYIEGRVTVFILHSDFPQDRLRHHFKVKFSGKDVKAFTVDGDPPCTVLEGIQKKEKYTEMNCPDNNLVIKLGRKDYSIVATHFPSSCVKRGEVLTISCESETVEDAKIQPATAIHSRDRYSVFYIHTVGGTNAKTKKLFKHDAVKKFTYVCVYGEKGTTVEDALQRDGRFSDDLCNFTLIDNVDDNCIVEPVDNVDSLNGKKFKIGLPCWNKKQQANTGASNYPQKRHLTRSAWVLKVVHQRGRSVRAAVEKSGNSDETDKIYTLLCDQFPALKELMQSRFPGESYQEALKLRKEDFGKIQQSFSEVHRVGRLLKLGRSVCKVIVNDVCEGSGFVLFDNFILTNAHLFEGCVEEDTLKKGVEVSVLFNYDVPEPDTNYCYFEVVNSYICLKKDKLDYAVLQLNTEGQGVSNPKTAMQKIMTIPPGLLKDVGPIPENGEVCLIGHPGREVKRMDPTCIIEKEKRGQAVYDNVHPYMDSPSILQSISHLIRKQGTENIMMGELAEKRLTYKTFMYHGSSGSPVFDAQCKVFGLHTGGYVCRRNPTESVIEYAQPLCAILKHFVNVLKTKGLEELSKRFEEAAEGNSEIQKVLKSVSETQVVEAEPADSSESMDTD